jgi:hypothetical protein
LFHFILSLVYNSLKLPSLSEGGNINENKIILWSMIMFIKWSVFRFQPQNSLGRERLKSTLILAYFMLEKAHWMLRFALSFYLCFMRYDLCVINNCNIFIIPYIYFISLLITTHNFSPSFFTWIHTTAIFRVSSYCNEMRENRGWKVKGKWKWFFQTSDTQQQRREEEWSDRASEAINLKLRADCFDFYLFLQLNSLHITLFLFSPKRRLKSQVEGEL